MVSDRSGQLEQNFHPNDSDDPLGIAHSKVSLNSMCILSVNGSNTKIHSAIRKVTELLSQNDALGKFHSIGASQTGGGPTLHFGPFSKKLKSNSKNQKKTCYGAIFCARMNAVVHSPIRKSSALLNEEKTQQIILSTLCVKVAFGQYREASTIAHARRTCLEIWSGWLSPNTKWTLA